MIKLVLKISALLVVLSSIAAAGYKIGSKVHEETLENNIVLASFSTINQPLQSKRFNNKLPFKDYSVIKDVDIFLEGSKIKDKNNFLCKNNRYYFATSSFEKSLGYTVKVNNDNIYVYNDDKKDSNNSYYVQKALLHDYLEYNNTIYLSMIDLTEALNLTVSWNYDNSTISFYKVRTVLPREARKHFTRPALIRLEDVAAGNVYTNNDNLQKLRIISDYMYSKDVPFHIAWIPRYMYPEKGIDNDLLEVYSMPNADFVYTLDYMISRGGIVGLHGYTHQYGIEESIIGAEFGDKACHDIEETKARIEAAIATAKALDIPYEFFESPHYRSTKEQQQYVFENYFNYMYEPSKALFNTRPALSKSNNKTIYVPAPLGYVHDDDVDDMINRIKTKPKDYIASMFYHPSKEFKYITLLNRDGYPEYEYSESSILHRLLNSLNQEGYTPVKITDIKLGRKKS